MPSASRVSAALLLSAWIALATAASAQFNDYSWTYSGDPSGFGTVTAGQMHVVGPANDQCTSDDYFAFLSTTATQAGTVFAHYDFDNQDGGFGWWTVEDPAYVVGGVQTIVGPGDIFSTWQGDISFYLHAGQTFGFGVVSADCSFGPGVLDVTDFVFVADAWQNLGHALAGTDGPPQLVGLGTLQPGSPYTLGLVDAAKFAPAWLIVGLAPMEAPFKGGVLVPNPAPPGLLLLFNTGPSGRILLNGIWPAGPPSGFSLYFQYWIADPAGPLGFAASNSLSATIP